ADRVVGQITGDVEHDLPGQRRGPAVEQHPAQVDVPGRALARGEREIAAHDRLPPDDAQQAVAGGGPAGTVITGHGCRAYRAATARPGLDRPGTRSRSARKGPDTSTSGRPVTGRPAPSVLGTYRRGGPVPLVTSRPERRAGWWIAARFS